jgi:hypothetical protein
VDFYQPQATSSCLIANPHPKNIVQGILSFLLGMFLGFELYKVPLQKLKVLLFSFLSKQFYNN